MAKRDKQAYYNSLLYLDLKPDDSDAGLTGMLLHIIIERHGFEHDFLVDAAGIEQVQLAVLSP